MRPFGVDSTTLDKVPTLGFVVAKATEAIVKTAADVNVAAAMVRATVLRKVYFPHGLLVTCTEYAVAGIN
jgi:hypothetical protein